MSKESHFNRSWFSNLTLFWKENYSACVFRYVDLEISEDYDCGWVAVFYSDSESFYDREEAEDWAKAKILNAIKTGFVPPETPSRNKE